MKKTKYYLAGKISGDPNYTDKFCDAEFRLEDLAGGGVILNPAVLPDGLDDEDYMAITGRMLYAADVVVMLPDWTESLGSKAEYVLARRLGKPVMMMFRDDAEEWHWEPVDLDRLEL